MAYATEDRIGAVRIVRPLPRKQGFLLGADQVIYKNTLCGVAEDGKLYNLNPAVNGGVTILRVLYADEHLEKGATNHRIHQGGVEEPSYEAIFDCMVYLPATGLDQTNTGDVAFVVDDQTVTDTGGAGVRVAGRFEKVLSSTLAQVYIDGFARDANIDVGT